MYNDEIKKILKATYDRCAYTLDIDSSVKRGAKLYFYTLDEKTEKEIVYIREMLNSRLSGNEISNLAELNQLLSGNKWEAPQCACYSEYDDTWELSFYCIEGVRYHKTYGRHIAATLVLQRYPIITLSERKQDTFYGFWDNTYYDRLGHRDEQPIITNGLNYRINRNLISNNQFRTFTSEFFSMIACKEKKYILKDISRTIKEWGYFLPSVSFQCAIRSHTPGEMINTIVPTSKISNINFNKIDMNIGYLVAKLTPFINKHDKSALFKITPELVRKCFSLKNIYDGLNSCESIELFIVNYFRYARSFSDDQIDNFVKDYVHMCLESNTPIKLSCSLKKLKEAHDDLMELFWEKEYIDAEQDAPLVSKPSKFDHLEKSFNFLYPNTFYRIHTIKQLLYEGMVQHNCVFSRRHLIKNDSAAIFHWKHENVCYTIQFAIDRQNKYYIEEIKARFNKKCTLSTMTRLNEIISDVNAANEIDRVSKNNANALRYITDNDILANDHRMNL